MEAPSCLSWNLFLGSTSSPVDNCELDLALSDSTPLRNDPPCHPVIRPYPTNDLRPPSISSIPSQEVACACFCPEKGNSPLLSVQVFGEFCATCVALLCFAMSLRQGPPHRNQEPHKLLCDSQNASHSHLTCGIKLSQPMMRGGFKKEWWWNWNLFVLFTSLSVPGRSVLSQGVAVLTGKTLGIVDTLVWYWITHTRESVTPSCFKWACSTSSWNHISNKTLNKLAVLHFCPCVTFI